MVELLQIECVHSESSEEYNSHYPMENHSDLQYFESLVLEFFTLTEEIQLTMDQVCLLPCVLAKKKANPTPITQGMMRTCVGKYVRLNVV